MSLFNCSAKTIALALLVGGMSLGAAGCGHDDAPPVAPVTPQPSVGHSGPSGAPAPAPRAPAAHSGPSGTTGG